MNSFLSFNNNLILWAPHNQLNEDNKNGNLEFDDIQNPNYVPQNRISKKINLNDGNYWI